MTYNKFLPNTKGIPKKYWDALNSGKFLIQNCNNCKENVFYPRVVCPHCGDEELEFKEHSGLAKVYSYTVVYKTQNAGFEEEVPYVVALVDLEDGARMMTNVVGCDVENVKIGMQVEVDIKKITDSISLPYFIPLGGKSNV